MPLCFWATQTAVTALGLFVGAGGSNLTPYLPPHSAASGIQLAYRSYVHRGSQHNNPTVTMLFACISFCLLCSCCLFNCAIKLAYKKYIQWKRYDWDVNFICHGLDSLHPQCIKRHIKMDAELELVLSALEVMTQSYNTG
jgi:hypothetical protein